MVFKVRFEPVSPGTTVSEDSFNLGASADIVNDPGPRGGIVNATDVQLVAVQKYLRHINIGTNTSAVETAITALG